MKVKTVEVGRAMYFLEDVIYNLGIRSYYDLEKFSGKFVRTNNSLSPDDSVRFTQYLKDDKKVFSIGYHFVRYGRDIITARVMHPDIYPNTKSTLRIVCDTKYITGFTNCATEHNGDNNVFFRGYKDSLESSSFVKMMRDIEGLKRLCKVMRN